MASQQDKQQIQAVIESWKDGFVAKDMEKVKSLWDQSYPQLLYIAEENDDELTTWAAINDYYNAVPGAVKSLDWRIDPPTIDVFGDGAFVYLTFHVNADIEGIDHEMTFNGRDTFVLRKTGGQWKIIHYHESLSRDNSHETWGWMFK